MRIGLVCQRTSPWAREAASRLQELGEEVHVIDFATSIDAQSYLPGQDLMREDLERFARRVSGIHVLRTSPQSQARYVLAAPQLRSLCRRLRIDFLMNLWGGGFALMSYLSAVRPYGVFLGGGDVLRVGKSWGPRLLTRLSLHAADVVVANGEYLAEVARRVSGVDVRPLYYGVDPERFRPGAPKAASMGILCTRGFETVYNNESLIRALALMPESAPDFTATFTAGGSLLSGAVVVADEILPGPVRAKTRFLKGVTDSGMLDALQAASIFVSMARYDGTSISLLEALSCGLFPVLSDIPQNREWIKEGKADGILVPLDDPPALAAALADAMNQPERLARARVLNREGILRHADAHATMADLVRYMEDSVRKRGER